MTDPRLLGVGAYAPRSAITSDTIAEAWDRHLASGIGQCAIPAGDEDALTMAWEAATRAIKAADCRPMDIAYLSFATTAPPIGEEELTARLGSMLGVEHDTRSVYTIGSTRAGTQTLLGALDAGPWADGIGLVVVADAPAGAPGTEHGHGAGAGAGAVVLGKGDGGSVLDTSSSTRVGPGERFRPDGEPHTTGLGVTGYDRQAYRETIIDAVEGLDDPSTGVDAVVVQAPDGRRPYRLASALGVDTEVIHRGTTVHELGDTGAACVLLGLVRAIEEGATTVLMAGYGPGAGADALLLDTSSIPVESSIDPEPGLSAMAALRRRGHFDRGEPAGGGAYISLPTWRRSLAQRHRLVAGHCLDCGDLNLPPAGACSACGTTTGYDTVELEGTGTIEAVTKISAGGSPPEFAEYQDRVGPFQTALVAFDGPGDHQVSLPVMVVDDTEVKNGDRVTSVIRRLYIQEGLPRYGLKVRSIESVGD